MKEAGLVRDTWNFSMGEENAVCKGGLAYTEDSVQGFDLPCVGGSRKVLGVEPKYSHQQAYGVNYSNFASKWFCRIQNT